MTPPTVLVVDDDPDMQLLSRVILEDAGFRVLATGDGDHALELFTDERVDVVLLDVKLPGIDGWELLEKLQAGADGDARVVMFSAHVSDEDRDKATAGGSRGYVTKPFQAADLVATVRAAIGAEPA